MATGYQDFRRLTYIQEQSAAMYFADIFRRISPSPVVAETRLIEAGKTWYTWDSVEVDSPGRIIILGTLTVMGE